MAQKYGDHDSQGRALLEENQADSINLLYPPKTKPRMHIGSGLMQTPHYQIMF